jgi:hypothetical protein
VLPLPGAFGTGLSCQLPCGGWLFMGNACSSTAGSCWVFPNDADEKIYQDSFCYLFNEIHELFT